MDRGALARLIAIRRSAVGLTQPELASLCCCDERTIRRAESDMSISVAMLCSIMTALGLRSSDLPDGSRPGDALENQFS